MIFFDLRKLIIIALIIICPLIFVNIQRNHLQESWFFKIGAVIVLPLRKAYSSFYHSITDTINLYTYLVHVKKNNRLLKKENSLLKAQLLQMQEMEIENQKLNQILQFKNKTRFQLLSARVIASDPFPEYSLLTIDKGSQDGVKKNQLAIVESGVIGYILRVQKQTSHILLLSNQNSVLPVTVQRSRVHGLIEGSSKNLFYLKYLKNEDDIVEGDVIVTNSIHQNFPAGLAVGMVSKIEKDEYGLNPKIEIRPAVKFATIEKLFIIL